MIKFKYEKLNIKNEEWPAAKKCYKTPMLSYRISAIFIFYFLFLVFLNGCGYSNKSLYSEDVRTVYVEMFDNTTARRDLEYDLTDAIAKRIETDTPYKIVSNRSTADTILSGKIVGISSSALTVERETGRSLENQAEVTAEFSWKNLKTGQYLVQNSTLTATSGYSQFESQGIEYASRVATNKLAERIVEQMQAEW